MVTNIDDLETPLQRELSATELQIARNVCTNIKNKRELFETLYNNTERFKFTIELKSCEGTTPYRISTFEASIANASSTYMEYNANQETYFKDIMTDQVGAMKVLCDSVYGYGHDHVQNTMTFSNYQLVYKVLINNGFDRVEISKQVKNQKGDWKLAGIESIDFISQKSQAPIKFFGVEKERIRKIPCDGNTFSSMKQTWLEAITKF
jgi:hypothetical protein